MQVNACKLAGSAMPTGQTSRQAGHARDAGWGRATHLLHLLVGDDCQLGGHVSNGAPAENMVQGSENQAGWVQTGGSGTGGGGAVVAGGGSGWRPASQACCQALQSLHTPATPAPAPCSSSCPNPPTLRPPRPFTHPELPRYVSSLSISDTGPRRLLQPREGAGGGCQK